MDFSSTNPLLQIRKVITSRVFLILFASLFAIFLGAVYLTSAQKQEERFLSITTLGSNMTAEGYYPEGSSTIKVGQQLNWHVRVYNHMGDTEYVSIRIKLLNSEQAPPNDNSHVASPAPLIYEIRQALNANSTWTIPLSWTISGTEEKDAFVGIKSVTVNGENKDNLDVAGTTDKHFRIVLEVWRYNTEHKDFEFSWLSDQQERSAWNQIWFQVANQIQDHNTTRAPQLQEPANSDANQAAPSDSNPVLQTGNGSSLSESSQNSSNTTGSVAGGSGGFVSGGSSSSGGGSSDTTPPAVKGIFSRPLESNNRYTHPVTITWVGNDEPGGSGIASCDAPTNYSGPNGTGIVLTGHCTDNAHNIGTGTVKFNYTSSSSHSYSLSLDSSEIAVGSGISATATTNSTVIKYVKFVWKDPDNSVNRTITKPTIIGTGNNSSAIDFFTAPNKTGVWTVQAHFLDTASNEVWGYGASFTVLGMANEAPIARADKAITLEDTPIVIKVLANDTDANGDSLTLSSYTLPRNGSVTENANGTFTYSPDLNFNGEDTFTYRISDGKVQSNNATVTVMVSPVNDSPIVDAGLDKNVNETTLVGLHGSATDVDRDGLKLSWSQIRSGAEPVITLSGADTLSPTFISPSINHTISPSPVTLTFKLVASDTSGATAFDTVLVTVNDVNKVPVADAGPNQTVNGASLVRLSGIGSDADGDALTYTWKQTAGPSVTLNGVNNANTSFIAPQVNATTVLTFELTVSDGFGGSSKDTVNIEVHGTRP